MGDFIRLFLERRGLLDQHIHLFSNLFHFDDAGRAYDYVRPIFHSHSKAHVWERIDDDTSFSSKTHIIVMGDSLGDLTMTHDDRSHTFLTIGFCNDDKHRQVFEEQFDVAVYGDGSFDSITELF